MADGPITSTKPVLDLDALERPRIRINGTIFELRLGRELSPMRSKQIQQLGHQLAVIGAKTEPLTPQDKADLVEIPKTVCRLVLIGPPKAIAALDDEQRWAVCEVFINPPASLTAPVMATPPAETVQ